MIKRINLEKNGTSSWITVETEPGGIATIIDGQLPTEKMKHYWGCGDTLSMTFNQPGMCLSYTKHPSGNFYQSDWVVQSIVDSVDTLIISINQLLMEKNFSENELVDIMNMISSYQDNKKLNNAKSKI